MQALRLQHLTQAVADLKITREMVQAEVDTLKELVKTLHSMTPKDIKKEYSKKKPAAIKEADLKLKAKLVCYLCRQCRCCHLIHSKGLSYSSCMCHSCCCNVYDLSDFFLLQLLLCV